MSKEWRKEDSLDLSTVCWDESHRPSDSQTGRAIFGAEPANGSSNDPTFINFARVYLDDIQYKDSFHQVETYRRGLENIGSPQYFMYNVTAVDLYGKRNSKIKL